MRSQVPVVALLAACLAGCSRPALPTLGTVPNFTLTDQSGQAFDSHRLDDRIWVADFIYTHCPGPCPRMSGYLRKVQDATDVQLVSFTVDPARDTPEVLAAYAKRFGAKPDRWHLLTGPQAELHQLARRAFMLNNVDGSLEHSTRLVLLDGRGRIRGTYDTLDQQAVPLLLADIDKLKRERA